MAILLILIAFLAPTVSFAVAQGTGLKMGAAADIAGSLDAKNQEITPSRIDVRDAEFGLYGPIDQTFDGNLNFAAHYEDGEQHLELHEAWLASSKLIPSTRIQGGKFFLGLGRLNRFHRHDWPFITTPKAHRTFFAEEAAADTGFQSNTILGFLPVYTDVTLGVTNGWTWGHSHSAGKKPVQPTHYSRIGTFVELGETGGLQTGINYAGRNSREDGQMKLFGLDATAKWRKEGVLRWLLQLELWGRNQRPIGGDMERTWGGYLWTQRHVKGRLDAGVRFDGYTVDTSPNKNLDYSVVPHLIWRHSEFTNFKLAYQWDWEKRDHKDSQVNRAVQVQAVFFLGDHPSHEF